MILKNLVKIERRYSRSARIDTDLGQSDPLSGYLLQASTAKVLTTMATAQLENKQGAFTWTGPFGGGKSSAALVLGNLIGDHIGRRDAARRIIGPELVALFAQAFPEDSSGWKVVPVTGSRMALRETLVRALVRSLGWTSRQAKNALSGTAGLLAVLQEHLAAERPNVLIVLDELGKFLEEAASTDGDIHLLQDLAEISSRSGGRFVLLGILHQTFDQYAGRLGREPRLEWAKVQGRFQDIPFLAGADETVSLLGKAIITSKRPKSASKIAGRLAVAIAGRRPTDVESLCSALEATWPLNPVTALLLGPISRQRFAQNERSVFGFLASAEPYGFVEFLQQREFGECVDYGPDALWDYLNSNFGVALAGGADGHRYSLSLEAVERATAKGTAVHTAVAKAAAIIELFRNGSGLVVNDEFIEGALPALSADQIRAAIADLVEWAVLIRQPKIGGYAVFAGSDFDLGAALRTTRQRLGASDFAVLPHRLGMGLVAAKRHYFRTGVLRAFDVVLVQLFEGQTIEAVVSHLKRLRLRGEGMMVLLFAEGKALQPHMPLFRDRLLDALTELKIIAAVGCLSAEVQEQIPDRAAELYALEALEGEYPQLQGDRIARREIASRRSMLLDELQNDLKITLDQTVWSLPQAGGTDRQGSLAGMATALADAMFTSVPIIKSELVQRERPSSNAMAAVRELAYAMVLKPDQEGLGMVGYPAERGLYLTLLQPLGLHRQLAPGQFGFAEPDRSEAGMSMTEAWKVMQQGTDLSLKDVFHAWRSPPFGMKSGVMSILALAHILARREQLAVYLNDVFQIELDSLFVDRYLQDPTAVRIKTIERSEQDLQYLRLLAAHLGEGKETNSLSIAQQLYARFRRLPEYVQKTDSLSPETLGIRNAFLKASDPEALLFDVLPALVRSDDPARAVIQALHECEEAYGCLLQDIRQQLAQAVGVQGERFAGIEARAQLARGVGQDLRFDAFLTRLTELETQEGNVEGLSSLLVNKPARQWSDRDAAQARLEIARFGRQFREAETLAFVQGREPTMQALAVAVGVKHDQPTGFARFELNDLENGQANHLAAHLLALLEQNEAEERVKLGALARVVAQLFPLRQPETL